MGESLAQPRFECALTREHFLSRHPLSDLSIYSQLRAPSAMHKSSLHRFRISKTVVPSDKGDNKPLPLPAVPRQSLANTEQNLGHFQRPVTEPSEPSVALLLINGDGKSRRGSQPACERCRRMKRKCSKNGSSCTICINGGLQCSFSDPVQSVSSVTQARRLQARVEWLTKFIDDKLPSGSASVEWLETGADIVMDGPVTSVTSVAKPMRTIEPSESGGESQESPGGNRASISSAVSPMDVSKTIDRHASITIQEANVSAPLNPTASPSPRSPLSERTRLSERVNDKSAALLFAEAYFRHIHRSYPFMDQSKVMSDVKTLGDFQSCSIEKIPAKLYILMAIGSTTLQRMGQVSDDTVQKFDISYPTILHQCLLVDDVDSVQTCLLLGLYSLFDPTTQWPWKVAGVLSRQVIRLGLNRQAFSQEHLPIRQVEMRHRLFWSVWTLDRIVSTTLGLPFGINDENINVPLPSITLEEYSSPESTHHTLTLQINRHVIALRRLEDQILQRIHFTGSYKSTSLSPTDKRIIVQELRTEIENWYTHGCLVTPQERDSIPFHNTIPWLNLRYQNLLLLLYTPSHFNSIISDAHLNELQSSAHKYIQLSAVLFQHRHMPLNWVTLCRFVALCPILLYCLIRNSTELTQGPKEELMCAEMLEAFPQRWHHAKRTAVILRKMAATANSPSCSMPIDLSSCTQNSTQTLGLEGIRVQVSSLVYDMLGESSIYTRTLDASIEMLQQRCSDGRAEKGQNENLFDSIWTENSTLWSDVGDFAMGVI